MGFKENLKSELIYSGILVKELAAKTGIKKHTLDNYLNTHKSIPNAVSAVKIAQALGVSVEYLVTGMDASEQKPRLMLAPDITHLVQIAEKLSPQNRKLAIKLLKSLIECDGSS